MHDSLIKFVLLTAGLWGMIELRGDVVPTSDSVPLKNLISATHFYVFSLYPPHTLFPSSNVRCPYGRGHPPPDPTPPPPTSILYSHRIVNPPGNHLYPFQNNDAPVLTNTLCCLCYPPPTPTYWYI